MIRFVCGGLLCRHFFCLAFMLQAVVVFGQTQRFETGEASYGIKLGQTQPLYLIAQAAPTDPAKLKEAKQFKPTFVPNFAGRRHEPVKNPLAEPRDGDPLFTGVDSRMPNVDILPTVNIEGMSESVSGAGVPDVNGEVGRDFYVQMVNVTYFRVYNKMGAAVSLPISANTIWNQVGLTSFGDPIILYDQQVDRWVMTEFASVGARTVLVAISDTPDPRGSWTAYKFQTPRFPDFPKYGIWHDAYYFTANETGSVFPVYAINREDMLAGEDTVRFQRLTVPKINGVGFEVGQPVDWDGLNPPPAGSPMVLVKLNDDAWGTTPQDVIMLHRITIDWDNAANSAIEVEAVPTAPYDTDGCSLESTGGFSCIPQPNNQGIDGAEWIITNKAVYRHFATHEAFVMSFLVDVTGNDVGGIRWIEFRRTPGQEWHIYQEGTVGSDDGLHRFMPTIAIDGQGNIGLGYGVSGYEKFPSLRYTGRYANDPLGTMTFNEYEIASGGGSWGIDRYGDYFSISVDPADDATFWFTGQYIPDDNVWSTRIAAFAATRDTFDLLPVDLVAPVNSADLSDAEAVVIDVLNRGLNSVDTFAVAYQFNQGPWVIEPAQTDSLEVDSVYRHTFAEPVAFTTAGTYPLRVAVLLDPDGNRRNDTLSFNITKYAHIDMITAYVPPAQADLICTNNTTSQVRLLNGGLDSLFTAEFALTLNGMPVDTVTWTGSLAFGESTDLMVPVSGLTPGENALTFVMLAVNGTLDELPDNNAAAWTLTAKPDGAPAFLAFLTDNFPNENTWELTDETGELLAEGGPYAEPQTTYLEDFCLDAGACYTFTVFDSFGDGMSAQGVRGDYQITNENGDVIAALDKPNGWSQRSSQFCLADTCLLRVMAGASPESAPGAADGFAMAEPANGLGNVSYSIDGGNTFQASPAFANLAAGTYTLIARDNAGCTDTTAFVVNSCTMNVTIETVPAIGGDVGQIIVHIDGAIGEALVSLDGGAFATDTLFSMLEPGEYVISVKDSLGCAYTETVTVFQSVSTTSASGVTRIAITPNPGRGLFDIAARLDETRGFIPVTVFTALGEPVLESSLVRFGETHRGQLVLQRMPAGTYYVAFAAGNQWHVLRIVNLQ